jgi:hypothetical protein
MSLATTKTPDSENKEVVSYFTMRKAIGWLGMALPFLLLIGNLVINNTDLFNNASFVQIHPTYKYASDTSWKSSVSHYYYTTMGEIFTGTLFAVALFMICYTGHKKRKGERGWSDNVMTNLAGLCAMGVAIFPTSGELGMTDNLRSFISTKYIGVIHYVFAGSFFVLLALMSIINFRRSQKIEDFGKGKDDDAYLTYGIVMLACLVLVPILGSIDSLEQFRMTFVLEAIALVAFGSSWLRKGKADFMFLPKKLGIGKAEPAGEAG